MAGGYKQLLTVYKLGTPCQQSRRWADEDLTLTGLISKCATLKLHQSLLPSISRLEPRQTSGVGPGMKQRQEM